MMTRNSDFPSFVRLLGLALALSACGGEETDGNPWVGPGGGQPDSGPLATTDGAVQPGPTGGPGGPGGPTAGGTQGAQGGPGANPGQPGAAGGAGPDGGTTTPGGDGGVTTPTEGGVVTTPEGGVSPQPTGSEANYKDPGKGAWVKGTPAECKLDIAKLADTGVGNYAVFRYGKLCHIKGGDAAGAMFSATKTLGGTTAGRAAYLTKDIMRTGPGTGTILHTDKATEWLGSVSYNREATLAHVMSMCGHSSNLAYGSKNFAYDTVGSTQINTMIQVTEKAFKQLPGASANFTAFMKKELFDRMGMTNSSYSAALGISTGWNANLSDMGKLGTLLAHDGWYGGERLLARSWVYRMSHPAFEDANTSYGQLAWLNHRGNAAGIGGNITSGSNAKEGDPCAPAAFWPKYPSPSGAPDCRATVGMCKQTHDVGIFSAQGLNGQFIVIHPGLDMVIAARNFSGGDGPLGLWRAVRPAVVAMDPMFKGDEAAFCKAYGAGDYAPDLVMPRGPDL
jgi:hypothetical protein